MSSLLSRAAILSALFAVAGSSLAEAQQAQSLQWKFRSGQRLDYAVQQDMKMGVKFDGRQIDTQMTQIINTSWAVRSVDSGGNGQVTQRISRIRLTMKGGPLGEVSYDSAKPANVPKQLEAMTGVFNELIKTSITTVMSPTGDILKIDVPNSLVQALQKSPGVAAAGFNEESLKQMFNQSGVLMPAKPVTIGQKWNASNEVKTPVGRMVFNSLLNYRGIQDYQGRPHARIDLTPTVKIVPNPKSAAKITLKSADGSGAVLFDPERGRIVRTKLESNMVMDVEQNGQLVQQTIKQTVQMKLLDGQIASKPRR